MELENKELCKKCGGMCCKKSGCDYYIDDFEVINKNKILEVLETGNVSIVSALHFDKTVQGKLYCYPFLYLRARNIDRDIVDLFSMKKQCSMLTDKGCKYDINNRPGGGVNLIPGENFTCHPEKDSLIEINKWSPYQGLLSKIVKRYTGKSPENKLKEDIENVFLQIFNEEFDGISEIEILDILNSAKLLKECYNEEYQNALKQSKLNNKIFLKK